MSTISELTSHKEIIALAADSGNTAYDVADLMRNKKVGSVIVMDKKGQPLGIRNQNCSIVSD